MKLSNEDKKAILLHSAVVAVARDGLENTTTRSINAEAHLNEVYLYRNFKDKDELLAKAYSQENDKLMSILLQAITYENQFIGKQPLKERTAYCLNAAWKYLTSHIEECKYLVYYYNSPGFTKNAMENHLYWLDRLATVLLPTIPDKEEAKTMLYIVFNSVYGFAMQVANGQLPNTEETEEMVLRNIYTGIAACYEKAHAGK